MQTELSKQFKERLEKKAIHNCEVYEEDYEKVKPKIEMIQRLAEIESSIYAIFDLNRYNYLLQSEEQIRIFGLGNSDGEKISFDMHYGSIHPDDREFVLETDNMLIDFFTGMPFEEKQNYKLVYDFRTRNVDGLYLRYVHQSIPLEQDRNGKTWLTFVITNPISDRDTVEKPQRHLVNIKTGTLHLFNTSNSDSLLTKREREVLLYISRGYDSFNIADKLHISINTVNNHRQNILKKTKTENATQAVMYYKRLGLL